jgi:hypothetical protein
MVCKIGPVALIMLCKLGLFLFTLKSMPASPSSAYSVPFHSSSHFLEWLVTFSVFFLMLLNLHGLRINPLPLLLKVLLPGLERCVFSRGI